ncbi:hypothetical protein MOD72_12095 [Bacillus haynesii]|uniref:hypothetical protein n=1 Tax=Bacillus haynesii TaxID=1925021 RepID=UPI002280AF9D|nr:hypothetical protein [Bacillus haynesii]MCY8609918.1 hypothetical protein [Bacillus haynesii]MEC0752153.1 hypothetical protein [Bacillus haynesii]
MTLPEKLTINSIPYKVLLVDGFIEEDGKGGVQLGDINPWRQEIQVSKEAQGEYAAKILLHEAIHGILSEYGLERINNEKTVSALTAGFYDFIKTNDLSFIRHRTEVGNKQKIVDPRSLHSIGAYDGVLPDPETWNKLLSRVRVIPAESVETKPKSRPKQLPLVGSAHSNFPVAEMIEQKLESIKSEREQDPASQEPQREEPEHWTTGIKNHDGINYYRTFYICQNCGESGKRYQREESKYVKCHHCSTKLKKVPATDEGFPTRDAFGSFFKAVELYKEDEKL